jgi:FKBP-type peptidyl-prolyl cis-trans isomerase
MTRLLSSALALAVALAATGCQKSSEKKSPGKGSQATATDDAGVKPGPRRRIEPVTPPMDVAAPPADAVKSPGGLAFKSLEEGTGAPVGKNDTVSLDFTVWRTNGETMSSTKQRGKPQDMPLPMTAPGFVEALSKMKVGGHAMFWLPPEVGYRGKAPNPETLVYEVKVVNVTAAPAVPTDLAAPPATATKSPSGLASLVLKPGTGKDKPRYFDTVTMSYTAWDANGRMFDSSEMRKQPRQSPLFRELPGIEEGVTTMVIGQRNRFWIPPSLSKKHPQIPEGNLVYEVELLDITKAAAEPPTSPRDVAAPPADAQKTEKGTFYKVQKKGTGTTHPEPTDIVEVHYTGWTVDGRMFDSSVVRGKTTEFPLNQVIAGWTDGLQTMVEGETTRFWIPQELAYKGAPGKPAGMLVFDVTLVKIKAAPPPAKPPTAATPAPAPAPGKPATP